MSKHNICKWALHWCFIYLLAGCTLFEKEFILPLPTAQPATEITSGSFKAHWEKVTGAMSYEIDVATDKEFTRFVENYQAKKINELSIVILGLEANTPYYYRVRANISNQISKSSNVINITTEALDVPEVYPATEVIATGFRVHWKKMPIATAYVLEVALDEKFRNGVADYDSVEVPSSDTSFVVSNVTVNKQYFYRVRIKQANSYSEYSNVQSVFTSTLPRPEVLPSTNIQLTSFVANWKAMPEASSYKIDVASDALFQQMLPGYADRVVNTNSVVVSDLNANTNYFYRVRAVNAEATSNHSELMTVNTRNLVAPIATKASDVQSGSFQANWEMAANAASYLLDVALDENFSQILPNYNSKAIVGNSALIESIDASTNYYYRVRAQGLNAVSDYSNTILVVTGLLPAPVAEPASNQKVFKFTANWQAQADISSYLIDVATDANFINFVAGYQAKEVIGTSFDVNELGLSFRQTYYYRLRSKRLSKVSDYSNVIEVKPCIGNGCKFAKVDFLGGYSGIPNSSERGQTFVYDAQDRLVEILYHNKTTAKVEVTYNADNSIKTVVQFFNDKPYTEFAYTYTGGLLTAIKADRFDLTTGVRSDYESWTFTYDTNNRRQSWTIYRSTGTLKYQFKYTYDAKDRVTEIRNSSDVVIREYSYDDNLSPLALIHADLCFFIATNRDQWTRDARAEDFPYNEYRGFMPVNNVIREKTGSLELFIFKTNSKDVGTIQDGFFSATYTFSGCGF
ncbi:MAG TPA: hypothetical protein DCS93_12225 [Microscillaceae bacterium]|nr:hypothetical protein [Microscillaceae bacterium]